MNMLKLIFDKYFINLTFDIFLTQLKLGSK
jgi:hypothetical protein